MPRLRHTRAQQAWDAFDNGRPSIVAVDTETTGLAYFDVPFCATLTWEPTLPDEPCVHDCRECSAIGRCGQLESHYLELGHGHSAERDTLRHILGAAPTLVFHNAKFDLQKLIQEEVLDRDAVLPERIEDTQTMAHLLDENRSKGLKDLAVSELGVDDTIEVEIKSGPKKGQMKRVPAEKAAIDAARRKYKLTKDDGYEPLPRRVVLPYALKDTEFTLQLYRKLRPQITAKGLDALYLRELEQCLALLDIEAHGVAVDVPYLEQQAADLRDRQFEAEMALREAAGRDDLNPNSWQQLLDVLHSAGIHVESTDEATLAGIDHPLAEAIREYRFVSKLLNTYVLNLIKEQRDGIFHPNFNPNGARTGRMSSSSAAA